MNILAQATVGIIGLGGVGSAAAEALARSGLGTLVLVDGDKVGPTDINRQIIALDSTIGLFKTQVMQERIQDINPDCTIEVHAAYYHKNNEDQILSRRFDYIIDAIDSVAAKIDLLTKCHSQGIPIISAMGAGNKLDPTQFQVADISRTHTCPLARIVRAELRRRQIFAGIKTVFSPEIPVPAKDAPGAGSHRVPSSIAFVPPVAGYIMAGVVVKDLLDWGVE